MYAKKRLLKSYAKCVLLLSGRIVFTHCGCVSSCVAMNMGLTPCQNAHDHIAQGVNQNVVAIHMHPALVFTRGFQAWVLAVIDHFVAIAAVSAV